MAIDYNTPAFFVINYMYVGGANIKSLSVPVVANTVSNKPSFGIQFFVFDGVLSVYSYFVVSLLSKLNPNYSAISHNILNTIMEFSCCD